MVAYIDAHRDRFGVEPICTVLPIAPSTYFRHKVEHREPTRRSARAQRDEVLRAIIRRIYQENRAVYGPRKVWKQMGREGLREARCRVRRLMRAMGLFGAVRGSAWTTTTHAGPEADRPRDVVDRQFDATRPNQLWVSDFAGSDELRRRIAAALDVDLQRERPAIINVRHIALIERARAAMARAGAAARAASGSMPEEFVLADLAEAQAALEEVSGKRTDEDLLTHIFSRFCIGK